MSVLSHLVDPSQELLYKVQDLRSRKCERGGGLIFLQPFLKTSLDVVLKLLPGANQTACFKHLIQRNDFVEKRVASVRGV
jgi:hypothetical protein